MDGNCFSQCSSEGQICPPAEAGAPVAKITGDLTGDEALAETEGQTGDRNFTGD